MKPGTTIPIATWTIAVVTIGLWVVGFLTSDLPRALLSASAAHAEWIWTYATAAFSRSSTFSAPVL